jgi:hypothetical protein
MRGAALRSRRLGVGLFGFLRAKNSQLLHAGQQQRGRCVGRRLPTRSGKEREWNNKRMERWALTDGSEDHRSISLTSRRLTLKFYFFDAPLRVNPFPGSPGLYPIPTHT